MAKTAEDILKEYLIAIGFKVDEEGAKKARNALADTGKKIAEIGTIAAGAATALSASVIRIASSLESVYFASQRTSASVASIKALEYSAQQIGITAEESRGMLEGFARSLRMNPGLSGYLQSMGVNVNQDKVRMLLDLVDKLRSMPFPIAARIAQQFGISDENLLMMIKNYDEFKARQENQLKLAEQGGVSYDDMAQKAHKFMEELRGLTQRFEILAATVATRFLPIGEKVVQFLEDVVDYLIKADKATDGWSSKLLGLGSALTGVVGTLGLLKGGLGMLGVGGSTATAAGGGAGLLGAAVPAALGGLLANLGIKHLAKSREIQADSQMAEVQASNRLAELGYQEIPGVGLVQLLPGGKRKLVKDYWKYPAGLYAPLANNPVNKTTNGGAGFLYNVANLPSDVDALIKKYAAQFGVDVALAEAQAWAESRGKQTIDGHTLTSKKGALGVFQLMPDTAAQLGVDPKNLEQNIKGGVQYLADLLKTYKGNIQLALAAYNAGGGNVAKYGGIPPFHETQDYIRDIMANMDRYRLGQGFSSQPAVTMTQKTDIHVNGGEARETGSIVAAHQDRVNGDMLRDLAGVMVP